MITVAGTELNVFPLCLGGNVFSWTSTEEQSYDVLDAYAAAGGNFIDTADSYTAWLPGHAGGESETIIGRWMAARGNRDDIIVGTKVGKLAGQTGLAADNILESAHLSLERLQTDRIDLYYAHADDPKTPLEESLGAFDRLVREGKVRYIGASNFDAPRLAEALATSAREGFVSYVALQPEYNLVRRSGYEGPLRDVCSGQGLGCFPYYALASGFLTGKYRSNRPTVDSPRASGAVKFLDDRGLAVLSALDEIAAANGTSVAAVALAWLRAQPTVVAPIASARSTEQLRDLLPGASLELAPDELAILDAASATSPA